MKRYESTLPEGYREAMVIDAKSKGFTIVANLAALLVLFAVMALCFPIFCAVRLEDLSCWQRYLVLFGGMFAYLIAHELVHGAVYKLLTGQKLTFGMTATVAFCGVPEIYVYRTTALLSLLAPFAVFLPAFALPTLLLPVAADRAVFALLLAIHLSGCVGDLYDAFLYLVRFRSPDTLMNDTGPRQTFYTRG